MTLCTAALSCPLNTEGNSVRQVTNPPNRVETSWKKVCPPSHSNLRTETEFGLGCGSCWSFGRFRSDSERRLSDHPGPPAALHQDHRLQRPDYSALLDESMSSDLQLSSTSASFINLYKYKISCLLISCCFL